MRMTWERTVAHQGRARKSAPTQEAAAGAKDPPLRGWIIKALAAFRLVFPLVRSCKTTLFASGNEAECPTNAQERVWSPQVDPKGAVRGETHCVETVARMATRACAQQG